MSDGLWGVVIGGVIGIAASFIPHWWAHFQTKRAARALVVAYLRSMIEIAKARGHVEKAKTLLALWRGPDPNKKITFYGAGNDPLMPKVIEQISNLRAADAAGAAQFLTILTAIRIDMHEMREGGSFHDLPADQRIEKVEWDVAQWQRAEAIAKRLIERRRIWLGGNRMPQVEGTGLSFFGQAVSEAAAKQYVDVRKETVGYLFDKGATYTTVVVFAGYAALFTIWGNINDQLPASQRLVIGISLALSVAAFVYYEVYKIFDVGQKLAMYEKAFELPPEQGMTAIDQIDREYKAGLSGKILHWFIVFVFTVATSLVGALLLVSNMVFLLMWPRP